MAESTENLNESAQQPDELTAQVDEPAQQPDELTEQPDELTEQPDEPTEQPDKSAGRRVSRKRAIRLGLLTGIAFIVGFIILGIIAVLVWDYSNSVTFCANACHNVHPEEIHAFEESFHANIKCTECHMGRVGTLNNIVLKASHFRHLPEVIFDTYERPLESATMRPANESCELCHWPPAFHGGTVREITRFQPDEQNTQKDTYLIMQTGAGEQEMGEGFDIHWHVSNPVEYIATDVHKHDIPWVRTTLPDGRTVEYTVVTNPLTPEEIEAAETKIMDCVDCHNRVGHPFPTPEDLVDRALAEGHLDPGVPNAKGLMLDLVTAEYASRDEAIEGIEARKQEYLAKNPDIADEYGPQIEQAGEVAKDLASQLLFEEPGVSWADFPDHNKHKDFPGCFRCHDGKHMTDDGESIRLHCNICHNIPATVDSQDLPPEVRLGRVPQPDFHYETNFIADHRFKADDSCEECHGPIEFGADDSSFCANSSCHGRSWPAVDLDAAFPHPVELEGKHAEAWCHNCHSGERKPEYVCSNCHEPPMEPHFGDVCEDCHTPLGFEQADIGDFTHPIALEASHADLACSDCHTAGETLTYECANCHEPPSEPHLGPLCEDCHTPTSFDEATLPPELHPVPLEGAHQRATCDVCHAEGLRVPEYVCSNCHKPPENHLPAACNACHSPEGWAASASSIVSLAPEISHELEGRDDCLMCHDPAGQVNPAPSNHADYEVEQCVLCHKVAQ